MNNKNKLIKKYIFDVLWKEHTQISSDIRSIQIDRGPTRQSEYFDHEVMDRWDLSIKSFKYLNMLDDILRVDESLNNSSIKEMLKIREKNHNET